MRARTAESRALALLSAVHTGVWLGLLDPSDLHDLDRAHYDRAPRYTTVEHHRSGLFGWEQEAVDGWFPATGRVLVLAAGAGREVLALAGQGYSVEGFEPHAALVARGQELLGDQGRLTLIGRDRAPLGGGPYDAVVVGWCGYTLVPGRQRRIAMLREVRALVAPDAPLLLSFFSRPDRDPRALVVAAVGSPLRRLRGRPAVEPGDDLHANHVHRFTHDEVAAELAEGGFRMVRHQPQESAALTSSGWAVGLAR